jgi:uncharacterized protein (DUF58 family)
MKIRWPIIAILLIALVLAITGGATMMWRLFIFLLVLLAVSYIWLRLLVRQIEGRIDKVATNCHVGDYFEEIFTVTNNGRLPILVFEAEEISDLPGYRNIVSFPLASWGSHTWRSYDMCRHRGQYRIGAIKARIYDPLGFFYVNRELTDTKYVNVLPAAIALPHFQLLPRHEPGLNTRRWFAGEPGQNASRVREYASGDSLHHIHWHSTAHTGQLMVKEFDPDLARAYAFSDFWIILDMHRESVFGTGEETTTEYSIIIASSLVKKYLENDKKVGLITSGDHSYIFAPDTGEEQFNRIFQSLALVKPSGEVALEHLIMSQEERIAPGSAAVIITTAGSHETGASLRRLLARGVQVTAILLDAASFGGTASATDTARTLSGSGINAYIVRRGIEISRALDIRNRKSMPS